jgi:hypothetical protein
MKTSTIQNKKMKNTGVLFEVLVRQITADTLSGQDTSKALNILKQHFNASTELGKELQLYRAFFETSRLTEAKAIHFIDFLLTQRSKLDEKKLNRQKYELIKEIKQHYDLKEFLSVRVPAYTINASIYKTFATQDAAEYTDNIVNINDVVQAKFTLVEHLTGTPVESDSSNKDTALEEFKSQTRDLRLLSYQLAVDKFNEKYNSLDENQKALLKEYIENVSNGTSLLKYVRSRLPSMKENILEKSKLIKDKVMSIKLNEVASQLDNIGAKHKVTENDITAMMIAYEILKEQ